MTLEKNWIPKNRWRGNLETLLVIRLGHQSITDRDHIPIVGVDDHQPCSSLVTFPGWTMTGKDQKLWVFQGIFLNKKIPMFIQKSQLFWYHFSIQNQGISEFMWSKHVFFHVHLPTNPTNLSCELTSNYRGWHRKMIHSHIEIRRVRPRRPCPDRDWDDWWKCRGTQGWRRPSHNGWLGLGIRFNGHTVDGPAKSCTSWYRWFIKHVCLTIN